MGEQGKGIEYLETVWKTLGIEPSKLVPDSSGTLAPLSAEQRGARMTPAALVFLAGFFLSAAVPAIRFESLGGSTGVASVYIILIWGRKPRSGGDS